MNDLLLFVVVLGVGLSALVQLFTDPRISGRFIAGSLVALAGFAAHAAIGVVAALLLLPLGPNAASGVVVALLGWLGLGFLGLLRLAPRLREPPAFLMRFGVADALCLTMIVAGVVMSVAATRSPP